jgi:hypothetical protein
MAPIRPTTTSTAADLQSLCTAIAEANSEDKCLGLYIDKKSRLEGVFPRPSPWVSASTRELTSLSSLLKHPVSQIPTPSEDAHRLSMKERLILAVDISKGILQLHATPWLDQRWDKEDIMFLKNDITAINNSGRCQRPVDVKQPLVSKSLSKGQKISTTQAVPNQLYHLNPTLLDLGIVLLELYFGQAIEQKRLQEDLAPNGDTHSNTDLYVARRWLFESYQMNMSEKYWTAVKHCIDIHSFDLMSQKPDLFDETFREAVYEKVIVPLEMELKEWERVL